MKRCILILSLILPIFANAQSRHHFEIGGGYVIPGDMLGGNDTRATRTEKNTAGVFGEYRFDLNPRMSLGLQYFFTPNHGGSTLNEVPGYAPLTFETRNHTANLLFEYKLKKVGILTPFAGIGGGLQYRWLYIQTALNSDYYLSADLFLRFGLQLYDNLRISAGHFHDLHYPFSALSSGAPCYYIAASWAF